MKKDMKALADTEIVTEEEIKKVLTIGKKSYVCYDLTYGFLLGIENGTVENTKHAVIENGTDMDHDEVMNLRMNVIDKLYAVISRLTYPTLYDEDGNLKETLPPEEGSENKKKV